MLIVYPYSPIDQELAVKLAKWLKELGRNEGHSVLIVRDVRCHANNDASIKHDLESIFDKVEVINVVERIDGWPLAPNIIFRTAAKHIQMTNPQPWLWIEADCVPLKSGWVDALAKEYDAEPRKPFLGDFVNVEGVIPHCSGISVYPPMIINHAPSAVHATDTAWDCWAADEIVPRMKQTHLIKHRWKHPPFNNQSEVDNLLGQLGDAVLFHADKSGTLIDFLRERKYGKPALQEQAGNKNAVAVTTGSTIGNVDIFIKTYPKDYPWLEWCLRSIQKFASGFGLTHIVSRDVSLGENQKWHSRSEYGNDAYLSQQVFKLYADTFTDADWILHTDSDTIFTRPVTPETYLKNGKFVWMMTPMSEAHPNQDHAWRRVMHKFLGKEPEFEFMRRHPFLLPRWLYGELRAFCVRQHGVELKDYVMAQPYREFSEFNVIGFYAYEYHRDKFEWINTAEIPESEWPELTVDQRWSHDAIPVKEWEKILGDGHDNNKSQSSVVSPGQTESESSKLIPQFILEEHLKAIAQHFTSPLAKGRIFKRLKSYPITK